MSVISLYGERVGVRRSTLGDKVCLETGAGRRNYLLTPNNARQLAADLIAQADEIEGVQSKPASQIGNVIVKVSPGISGFSEAIAVELETLVERLRGGGPA